MVKSPAKSLWLCHLHLGLLCEVILAEDNKNFSPLCLLSSDQVAHLAAPALSKASRLHT